MNDLLQELSSTSHSDSSPEESAGEENKKEDAMDEDDQAERAQLPQYGIRFKVGVFKVAAEFPCWGEAENVLFSICDWGFCLPSD